MVDYKTILYGSAAALAGAALYKYGVQDINELFAPIRQTLDVMINGNGTVMSSIPGAIEAAGLAAIVKGAVR